MTEKRNEEAEKAEKAQFEGILQKDKLIISNLDGINEIYFNSYIGTLEKNDDNKEILVLDPVEVLLLCERKRILVYSDIIRTEENLYEFEDLLEYFSQFDDRLWQKYIIYMDLRKRGYIVRAGYGEGIDFRVYKRGADFEKDSAKFLIYPVFEGYPIDLRDLDKMSRVAMSSRKDLVVATVDRLSKPIYYSVNKFEIMNKVEEEEE
ncbi:MAG: tRNA-intron lyase [Candidatus Lokiarchaeota archaeon]|nr:tRNA-intron lyase [Candidatus Lokiarchaeota archaeon]